MSTPENRLPLAGIRVVEITHMVMGPTCGMVLADLGAEVVKIEPLTGDKTRQLLGAGAGFFAAFNRNKKSIAIDLTSARGQEIAQALASRADVFSENFKPGGMTKYGLDAESLRARNPRLIYVSHKGFLPGPYEHRTALDEVVQMMGGLAYMTGPAGQPLRAGSSVNDIMGGIFGALGVLAKLYARDRVGEGTGTGGKVQSALFENNVLLVAQHMLQYAITGEAAAPMPSRISAWGVYDVFTVSGGEQIFLAVVSDTQWATFCREFAFEDLARDPAYATNNRRVSARATLIPHLQERLAGFTARELATRFEQNDLPYAPITRPEALFHDPHLTETGGLAPITVAPDASGAGRSIQTAMPLLPVMLDGARLGIRTDPPSLGADTDVLLSSLGHDAATIAALRRERIVA
jgi:crotonobetainyl-CoA:carnitine CoA-transferase CaiB-like acyl-CoA transferase